MDFAKQKAVDDKRAARAKRIDELVDQGIAEWDRKGELYHIVNRQRDLTNEEVASLVFRVFDGRGKPRSEAEEHLRNVMKERERRGLGA